MTKDNKQEIIGIAIKQVPAVKYALGVAGIVAVIANIISWGLNPMIVIVGVPIMILLMAALVLFVQFSDRIGDYIALPMTVLVWAAIIYIIATPAFCIAIVVTEKPAHLYELLTQYPRNLSVSNSPNIITPPSIQPKQDIVKTQSLDIVVPWNGSTKAGKISIPVDSKYEYVSHTVIEISKNGNATYINRGLVNSEVIVEYEISPQGSFFDQKRSWLNLELQVTLRDKS